jgi:hypothetical protein
MVDASWLLGLMRKVRQTKRRLLQTPHEEFKLLRGGWVSDKSSWRELINSFSYNEVSRSCEDEYC